jgi:hypothetical protein
MQAPAAGWCGVFLSWFRKRRMTGRSPGYCQTFARVFVEKNHAGEDVNNAVVGRHYPAGRPSTAPAQAHASDNSSTFWKLLTRE